MRTLFLLLLLTAGNLLADSFYVNVNNNFPSPPYNTPADAATHLSNITALAANGDVILFATGTYYLSEAILVTNDISFVSTNPPGTVIIDGGLTTKCFAVSESSPEFHGLTIEHGNEGFGGAMSFYLSGAVISNCTVRNSRAQYGGGLYADQSPLLITDSTFHGNIASNNGTSAGINWPQTAGGGLFFKTSSALLENSVIANNQSILAGYTSGGGGGIAVFHPEQTGDGKPKYAGRTSIKNCLIISNSTDYTGGGTACLGANLDLPATKVQVWFENCRWIANSAQYGGGFFHVNQGTQPLIVNSLFANNTSDSNGAAIRVFENIFNISSHAQCVILNSTITENRSTNNRAIYLGDGSGYGTYFYMANCISWSNQTLSDIRTDASEPYAYLQEAEYNCLERDYIGPGSLQEGNITNNPLFTDTLLDDFRLSANSPCIDAGTNNTPSSTDYFGEVRVFGEDVDMGFDEAVVSVAWTPSNSTSSITTLCPPGSVLSLQQSGNGSMSSWQDIGPKRTSMTDRIEFETAYTGAIRAVWHRP